MRTPDMSPQSKERLRKLLPEAIARNHEPAPETKRRIRKPSEAAEKCWAVAFGLTLISSWFSIGLIVDKGWDNGWDMVVDKLGWAWGIVVALIAIGFLCYWADKFAEKKWNQEEDERVAKAKKREEQKQIALDAAKQKIREECSEYERAEKIVKARRFWFVRARLKARAAKWSFRKAKKKADELMDTYPKDEATLEQLREMITALEMVRWQKKRWDMTLDDALHYAGERWVEVVGKRNAYRALLCASVRRFDECYLADEAIEYFDRIGREDAVARLRQFKIDGQVQEKRIREQKEHEVRESLDFRITQASGRRGRPALIECAGIYIISREDDGLIKIGKTGDFRNRFFQIRRDCRSTGHRDIQPVLLIPVNENRSVVEQRAHNRLSQYRTAGEWFKCDADTAIRAVLDSLN